MEVAFVLLADYANVTKGGKLNLLGLFDNKTFLTFLGLILRCSWYYHLRLLRQNGIPQSKLK